MLPVTCEPGGLGWLSILCFNAGKIIAIGAPIHVCPLHLLSHSGSLVTQQQIVQKKESISLELWSA